MAAVKLSVRLDAKLHRALTRLAKRIRRSKSEIARDALKRHLAVAQFRYLRSRVIPIAKARGLNADEDVFRLIS